MINPFLSLKNQFQNQERSIFTIKFLESGHRRNVSVKFFFDLRKITKMNYFYVVSVSSITSKGNSNQKLQEKCTNLFVIKFINSAKENKDILNDIQSVDPIGLNVYLTEKNV